RPTAGESHVLAQARALAQAGRAVPDHRGVQPGSLPGAVRPWRAPGLGRLGRSGPRRVPAELADLRAQFRPSRGRPRNGQHPEAPLIGGRRTISVLDGRRLLNHTSLKWIWPKPVGSALGGYGQVT